jgi:hypothetical protein
MKDMIHFSIPTSRAGSGMVHFPSSDSPRRNALSYSPFNASPRKLSRTEILQILDEAIAVVKDHPVHRPSAADGAGRGSSSDSTGNKQ